MTNIRRHHIPNATAFMTAVCAHREKNLEPDWSKELLASVLNEVTAEAGVSIIAYVFLNDHFHWLVDLSTKNHFSHPTPVGQVATNGSYLTPQRPIKTNPTISDLMQSIKLRFTHRYKKAANLRGNISIWQRRFWDHIIRDQNDYNVHLDYIHYNPVKHGYATRPADYPWSSFGMFLEDGIYPPDWGCNGDLPHLKSVNWE